MAATYDEGVPLACEDLDGVDGERLVVDRVDLDDGHVVAVDGEREVRVARHGDEAEAVALALGDGDDGEVDRVAPGVTADSIDEDSVRTETEVRSVRHDRQTWNSTHRTLELFLVAV